VKGQKFPGRCAFLLRSLPERAKGFPVWGGSGDGAVGSAYELEPHPEAHVKATGEYVHLLLFPCPQCGEPIVSAQSREGKNLERSRCRFFAPRVLLGVEGALTRFAGTTTLGRALAESTRTFQNRNVEKACNRNTRNRVWRRADDGRYPAGNMGMPPKPKARAKILLVDDYEVVRRGLRNLLARRGEWEVCGEAENGRDALEKVAQLRPDLVFLDVTMPVMNGFETAQEIRRRAPSTKIVIFTMHESSRMAEEAKGAGADAYLVKSTSLEMIENTISDLLELEIR
jgi:CheY-like chemotaxis protein